MELSKGRGLMLQAEKALPQPVQHNFLTYCPTMDLIAVITQDETLDVYRLNGQRAFGLKPKNASVKVTAVCWKFNGHYLAIAWDDGTIDHVSAESGKVVRHEDAVVEDGVDSDDEDYVPPSKIRCIGWGLNFSDARAVKARTSSSQVEDVAFPDESLPSTTEVWEKVKDEISLDDFLDRQPDFKAFDVKPDLPEQLALVDVEGLLPKLPVLPLPPVVMGLQAPAGDSAPQVFTTQPSMDVVFHSHHLKDHNAVDVLMIGSEDGNIGPMLYDSLKVGHVNLLERMDLLSCRPLQHVFHPYTCSHMVLTASEDAAGNAKMAAVPLTLGFIPTAGIHLHIVATKSQQLQNLLRYIRQCLRCISSYWAQAQDLPSRFMRSINMTLEEKDEGNLIQQLYHIAVTGNCSPTMKEWLVDELTESGHKRWDHAVVQGYTKIIELVHENLLPALDRCNIVASRLRGLARYDESETTFNVPAKAFSDIIDNVRNLRLLGHHVLTFAMEEKKGFVGFSKWLRREIDIQAADPSSTSVEETAEQELPESFMTILGYVENGMTQSKLIPLLKSPPRNAEPPSPSKGLPTYSDVKKALEKEKQGKSDGGSVLMVWSNFALLEAQSNRVFSLITSWQLSSTSMGFGIVLEDGEPTGIHDMRMVSEVTHPQLLSTNIKGQQNLPGKEESITTCIALNSSSQPNVVNIHRIIHPSVFDSLSSLHSASVASIKFPTGSILDLEFADDDALLVLFRAEDSEETHILSFTYRDSPTASPTPALHYTTRDKRSLALPTGSGPSPKSTAQHTLNVSTPETLQAHAKHTFAADDRFKPTRMDVNGRKDRRVVVVLAEDGKKYRVYDLDHHGGAEGDTTVDTTGDVDMESTNHQATNPSAEVTALDILTALVTPSSRIALSTLQMVKNNPCHTQRSSHHAKL